MVCSVWSHWFSFEQIWECFLKCTEVELNLCFFLFYSFKRWQYNRQCQFAKHLLWCFQTDRFSRLQCTCTTQNERCKSYDIIFSNVVLNISLVMWGYLSYIYISVILIFYFICSFIVSQKKNNYSMLCVVLSFAIVLKYLSLNNIKIFFCQLRTLNFANTVVWSHFELYGCIFLQGQTAALLTILLYFFLISRSSCSMVLFQCRTTTWSKTMQPTCPTTSLW